MSVSAKLRVSIYPRAPSYEAEHAAHSITQGSGNRARGNETIRNWECLHLPVPARSATLSVLRERDKHAWRERSCQIPGQQ